MLPHNPNKIYTVSFDPRLQHIIDDPKLKLHASSKQILMENNQLGFTSFEIASLILQERKRTDVKMHITVGEENIYVPLCNWIGLSESIASSQSVIAVAIAAHEVGHALQPRFEDKMNNFLAREDMARLALFYSDFTKLLLVARTIISFKKSHHETLTFSSLKTHYSIIKIIALAPLLIPLIICCKNSIITIVILREIDASIRAIHLLKCHKILNKQQLKVARKFLVAAGLTYIAMLFDT